jgi:hypothetical protein
MGCVQEMQQIRHGKEERKRTTGMREMWRCEGCRYERNYSIFNFNKYLPLVKYESFKIDDTLKVLTESTNCSVLIRTVLHTKLNIAKVIRSRLKRCLRYKIGMAGWGNTFLQSVQTSVGRPRDLSLGGNLILKLALNKVYTHGWVWTGVV